MVTFRAAFPEEYQRISDFYDSVIDKMADAEYKPGWEKGIYPAPEFLRSSLENGELYVGETDGRLCCAMVANQSCTDGYDEAHWSIKAAPGELLVLHALCTHPDFARRGIAGQLTDYAIRLARENGLKAIRLDVLGGNLPAEKTYVSRGFRYVDTLTLYYEDTGWTDFRLFEYNL